MKGAMRILAICFWVFMPVLGIFAQDTTIDRKAFYQALSTGDTLSINEQLKRTAKVSFEEKEAYVGVLLMRKAEFAKPLQKKLDLFKSGKEKLEKAIAAKKMNGEYRFLRLLIQENAPKILKYNESIEEDARLVKELYSKLPAETRKAIVDYTKRSKVLLEQDF